MANAQLHGVLRHLQGLRDTQAVAEAADAQLLEWFAGGHEEAPFAALVRRHGPMVWGVSRRVLPCVQDAEDVFQATFLLLARKAASIRKAESVGSWLHGVAHRLALKARLQQARRQSREKRAVDMRQTTLGGETSLSELQTALDTALGELPEKYRAALVLCYLEGKTQEEAARQLGCPLATLRTRVARGRKLLRDQLVQRGLTLTAAGLATLLIASAAPAAAPAALVKAAVRAALPFAAGQPAAALCSKQAAGLVEGGLRAMAPTKTKTATALLLAAGLLAASLAAGTAVRGQRVTAADEPTKPPASTATPPPPHAQGDRFDVSGRVLDPDGKPVTGAELVFVYESTEKVPDKVWATSAADGEFRFPVARGIEDAAWDGNAWEHTYVVAAAEGYGFACARVRPETLRDLTLRLVKDDVPIRGRVLDLQGKPVAGATVRIIDELLMPAVLFPPVQTGADGLFRINGIGRDRVATLRVEGPTIATQRVQAVARPPDKAGAGPRGVPFDLLAVPTRPVVGVVRDKETGKPLSGVVVRSSRVGGEEDFNGLVRTTTDKDGHYRLVGLPKGQGNAVMAEAWGRTPRREDLPYLAAIRKVGDSLGLEPVTLDIGLRRGVWVKGRVIDKATGKGVPAGFDYFCFGDNPFAKDLQLPNGVPANWTQKDGSFRVVALPGRGLLGVRATRDIYRMGVGAEQIKKSADNGQTLDTLPYFLYPGNVHTVAEIAPKAQDESITCDVYLDPGHPLQGMALGPDGKPLAGARALGLRSMPYWEDLKTAEFTILSLGPDETRTLEMVHEGKKLAGQLVVRGDEKGPVRVRLEPWGVVTGRLVKPDGEPMTGVTIYAGARDGQPDKEGKFRIDGLAPGLKFGLSVIKPPYSLEISGKDIKELTLRPGETKDLGDIRVKPME